MQYAYKTYLKTSKLPKVQDYQVTKVLNSKLEDFKAFKV